MESKTTFFTDLNSLNSLIEVATESKFKLTELHKLLSDNDVKRTFFLNLEDPAWISLLNKARLFEEPPQAEETADESIRVQQWPQSQYLARMASKAPEEVANILSAVETDNWTIARDIIRAAKEMPAKYEAKLAPKIANFVVELKLFHELQDVGEIIAKLATGKEVDAAIQLVGDAYGVALRDPTSRRNQADYGYLEAMHKSIIPSLIPVRASELVHLLVTWLLLAVESENKRGAGGDDYSYVWRPAIEDHEQNKDYNFAAKFITCVRDAISLAIKGGKLSLDEAIQILKIEEDSVVLKRLRLHFIANFADQDQELACQTMLNRDLFHSYQLKHEYAQLMGKCFPLLDKNQKDEWLSWIDAGPEAVNPDYFDPSDDEATQKIQREYWQFKKYDWINEYLTGNRAEFYQRMLEEKGKPELADFSVYSGGGRWGSESPFTIEKLKEMEFEAAVTKVTEWCEDEKRSIDQPDYEGLTSTFRQYVASDPITFSEKAALLINKQNIYVRAYVRSMEEAVKAGKLIDLRSVFELCNWVISRPIDEKTSPAKETSPILVKDWEWSRNSISDLMRAVCQAKDGEEKRIYSIDLRKGIWDTIESLSNDPIESNVIKEDAEKDPRITDWPMLALNSPRGCALHAVFDYADWVADHIVEDRKNQKQFPEGFEKLEEVRDLLDEQLTRTDDYFTGRAIFGWRLGLLWWLDKKWLKDNADKIFDLETFEEDPSTAYGWAAWTTFLYACRPHVEFYKILKEQFSYAVDQARTIEPTQNDRERPFDNLGEHLIVLLGRGDLGKDPEKAWNADNGIVKRLVTKSHPSVRSHAMAFIGNTMPKEEGDEVPSDAIERFRYLWGQYWEAIGKKDAEQNPNSYVFGQWFSSGAFGDQWSIEQLEKFVTAAPKADPDHMIMQQLAKTCSTDPLRSAHIVGMMVDGDNEGWRVPSWKQEAMNILTVAMKAGGDSKTEAEQVIDRLGRRGFLEFGELLKMPTKAG